MLDLTQQIIWNDTMSNPYSEENIARRLLAFGTNSEIVAQLTGISEEEQDILIEKNLNVFRKVSEKAKEASDLMNDLFESGEELHLLSDNPNIEFVMRTALLLSPDSYKLLSK